VAFIVVLAGALRGAGDTRMTLVIATVRLWLVHFPRAVLLSQHVGLLGT
jgi:Na+-driven multidrug efflux pump